jgi:hypothetical protein
MRELLASVNGTPDQVIEQLRPKFDEVLKRKRADVLWKLRSIRPAFEKEVEPVLRSVRQMAPNARPSVNSPSSSTSR